MSKSIDQKYHGLHKKPNPPSWVDVIAYQRKDEKWDVYIYEPKGSVPELEDKRVDDDSIFFKTIESDKNLDLAVKEIHNTLGSGYEPLVFFREPHSRKQIERIYEHLIKSKKNGITIREVENGIWEILVRRKDFPIAAQIIDSNLKS